jgi:DNA-damage-inducible protein D
MISKRTADNQPTARIAVMHDKSEIARLYATFEDCRFEHDGAEAWRARDLMPRLGYSRWENFREAIRRARQSCESAGIEPAANFLVGDGSAAWDPEEVFREATKNPQGGRPSEDVILTRRAAFLVVMNGDPSKTEIAFGQQYFAVATRTLEMIQKRLAEAARMQAREKLTETESRFQSVLYEREVDGPGIARIRSKGDAALFGGKDTKTMKELWRVPANRPLADFAPEVAVLAKQLATAITTHNVKTNENLRGEGPLTAEHVENNKTVHKAVKARGIDLGAVAPEEDIKKVERRHTSEVRKLGKPDKGKAGKKKDA